MCISFAGEDRAFVNRVVGCLKRRGIRYFYAEEVKADLWGKDLYTYLDDVYQHRARYGIMFVSKCYKKKRWTNHERQNIQARVFQEMGDYLLLVVLDTTDIPGLRLTTRYLDERKDTPSVIDSAPYNKCPSGKIRGEPFFDAAIESIEVQVQDYPRDVLKRRLAGRRHQHQFSEGFCARV